MGVNLHFAVVKDDGTLWVWGYNNYGQLGLGDISNRTIPTKVGTDNDWKFVACGYYHTTAIKNDGSLWTWGHNVYGQLGLGDTANRRTPVRVGTENDWKYVACGGYHTVAIKNDGTLWVWGRNVEGQLGLGDTSNRLTPVKVGTDSDWIYVACGHSYTVAIKSDGTLWVWGSNSDGQLGLGDTLQRNIPTKLGMDSDWKMVACGFYHTAAIKNDGTLWVWGKNNNGQLGLSDVASRLTPTLVSYDFICNYVSCGDNYTIVIREDGSLWGSGYNISGRLGTGDASERYVFVKVGDDTNWKYVSCGNNFTVSVKEDGTLWSWGHNNYGQLGLGDTNARTTPTKINNLNEIYNLTNFYKFTTKYLIVENNIVKTYTNQWLSISSYPPSEQDFLVYGMDSIKLLPKQAWAELGNTFDIFLYTDDPAVNSKKLKVTFDPIRPLDLLGPSPKVYTWTTDTDPKKLEIYGSSVAQFRYRVDLVESNTVLKNWTQYLMQDVTDSVLISKNLLRKGTNTVRVTVEQVGGLITTEDGIITVENAKPTITASMTGNTLDLTIGEPEGDKVQFQILLNGVKVYPESSDFTTLQSAPITYKRTFTSKDNIVIGQINTVDIIARDEYGAENTLRITFTATYAGLMFSDEDGNFYSTEFGDILQYLDVGVLIAGQVSFEYPVVIKNLLGYPVKNIRLWRDNKTLPSGATVELSATNNPFVPSDSLFYDQVLNHGEQITFYVRIVTDRNTMPGEGEFDILVKADPA